MKQDREAVRTLAIQIGVREAARQLGLNEDTVCSWAKRGAWFTPKAQPPSQAIVTQALQARPGDVLLREIAEHEGETRVSLARSARRMAKDSETATLRDAPFVHKAAQVAGIAFRWNEDQAKGNFTLNVLNMGTLDLAVRSSASEGDSQSSGTD